MPMPEYFSLDSCWLIEAIHMGQTQIERALRSWSNDAVFHDRRFLSNVDSDPAINAQFVRWWQEQITECLDSAACSAEFFREELNSGERSDRTDEMQLELSRLQSSLAMIRRNVESISASTGMQGPA